MKKAFEDALKAQLTTLKLRDRAILRLHVVEGVSIERIAAAYGVHRVTVARWIWNAGEIVLEGVRRYFKSRYGIVPSECDSIVHLVRSNLSLDLPRLLAD
jgi:RNA polymerase sigma-70 factor, ECF subfamily